MGSSARGLGLSSALIARASHNKAKAATAVRVIVIDKLSHTEVQTWARLVGSMEAGTPGGTDDHPSVAWKGCSRSDLPPVLCRKQSGLARVCCRPFTQTCYRPASIVVLHLHPAVAFEM